MPRTTLLMAGFLMVGTAFGADDFASFRKQQNAGMQRLETDVQDYDAKTRTEFDKYTAQVMASFNSYRRKAGAIWGPDAKLPDKQHVVEYGPGMKDRRVIDLEQGVARVEIVVDPSEAANPRAVAAKLQDLVQRTVTDAPDNRSIVDIGQAPDAVKRQGEPILSGLVKDDKGQAVSASNAAEFAANVVTQNTEQHRQVGDDGMERVVVSTEFPLVPNHIKVRAEKFRDSVKANSSARRLDPKLVYAIMETESFFNPLSKSVVPAFGLMQLVPTSGAADAYKYLHNNETRLITDTYLYDPNNNIELGSAYLAHIYYDYMGAIQDPTARLWCTIASYNTGPGNVFRTFVGKYTRESGTKQAWQGRAVDRINSLASDEVYEQLRRNLPFDETRQYVQRVRERMPKYGSM